MNEALTVFIVFAIIGFLAFVGYQFFDRSGRP